jgi:hypothetical protein
MGPPRPDDRTSRLLRRQLTEPGYWAVVGEGREATLRQLAKPSDDRITLEQAEQTISVLQRRLALAVRSNERLRGELANLRPEHRRQLRLARSRVYAQKQRAELWRTRATR